MRYNIVDISIHVFGVMIAILTIQQALINPFGEPVFMGVLTFFLWGVVTKMIKV